MAIAHIKIQLQSGLPCMECAQDHGPTEQSVPVVIHIVDRFPQPATYHCVDHCPVCLGEVIKLLTNTIDKR